MSADAALKSLELLYGYTEFHIGVYLTLTAAYIGLTTASVNNSRLVDVRKELVWVAIVLFMIAGVAGGVIASSITQCNCASSATFLQSDIGLWNWKATYFKALHWTWIEHTSFWAGLIAAIASIRRIGS